MILFITPLLGSLRNFVKYKQFFPLVFLRTPIIYFLLYITLRTKNIWKIIVLERWLMFLVKTIKSIYLLIFPNNLITNIHYSTNELEL